MDKIKQYQDALDKELSKYPIFERVEALSGVPKSVVVGGAGALFFLMIIFNFAGNLITNIIGWLYPAYASFKAIESPSKDDDKQWLTYWTVIGFFNIIEYFSDFLLFWLPFYYLIKTCLLIWLCHPYYRGAETVYNNYLRDFLTRNSSAIDNYLAKAEKAHENLKKN